MGDLERLTKMVEDIENFARINHINVNVKIYDIDYEQNTTITYDIPQ